MVGTECRVTSATTIPALKVSGCGNVVPLGVERGALGQPPMWSNALPIDAKASACRHHDEAVVFEFTEPALHGCSRFRAQIVGCIAIGPVHFPVVEVVVPQEAAQHVIETAGTKA